MAQFLHRSSKVAEDGPGAVPEDYQPAALDISNATGKQIQFRVPLLSNQKLIDEEQGGGAVSVNGTEQGGKKVRPRIDREYSKTKHRTLEIVQTRSYPERDRQNTVILTDRKLDDQPSGSESTDAPDIRWIHQRADPDSMSFGELQTVVGSRIPELRNDEIALALRLLDKVQTSNAKPFVRGKYGMYLTPLAWRHDASEEPPRHAIFFSLPYFDLKPLTRLKPLAKNAPTVYPTRTLLQSHHRLASTEERDKKQAFRKLVNYKNDRVLYLPQLWCMIINNKTVITYATTDTDGLFGTTITSEKPPSGPKIVRYQSRGFTRHLLIEQCQTFTQLRQTIQIHEETFNHDLQTRDGEKITQENWPKKISQEKSIYIDLYIYEEPESESDTESDTQYVVIEPREPRPNSPSPSEDPEDPEIVMIEPLAPDYSKRIDEIFERLQKQRLEEAMAARDSATKGANGRTLSGDQIGIGRHPRSGTDLFDTDIISPVRRAQTIGMAPSTRQRLEFNSEADLDPDEPRLFKRHATIDLNFHSSSDKVAVMEPEAFLLQFQSERTHSPSPSRMRNNDRAESPRPGQIYDPPEQRSASLPRKRAHSQSPTPPKSPLSHVTDKLRRRSPSPRGRALKSLVVPVPEVPGSDANATLPKTPEKEKLDDKLSPKSKQRHRRNQSSTPSKTPSKKPSTTGRNASDSMFLTIGKEQPSPMDKQIINATSTKTTPTPSQALNSKEKLVPASQPQPADGAHGSSIHDSENSEGNYEAMAKTLDDIDNILLHGEDSKETQSYIRVEKKSLKDVEGALKDLLIGQALHPSVIRQTYTLRKIVNIAKQLLEAFTPSDYPYPIVERFWGGVYLLLGNANRKLEFSIQDGIMPTRLSDLSFILKESSEFLEMVEYIRSCLSIGAGRQRKPQHRIPPALFEAFPSIVMFFILHGLARTAMSNKEFRELIKASSKCTDQCREYLIKARHQLIVNLHTEDDGARVSYDALESETLLSFVMENLLGNPLKVDDIDFEIVDAYSEYMSGLEIRVREDPSVKIFSNLRLLSEELDIIEKTLLQQLEIMLDYRQITRVNEDDYDPATTNPYSTRLREIVLGRCVESLRQKVEDIGELKEKAGYLQFSARQLISIRAESNDKAILVFTVVTVIFLPLTFVAGYFGMNVSDIRELDQTQSLFWIISLPVTFAIGSLAILLLMGSKLRKLMFNVKTEVE